MEYRLLGPIEVWADDRKVVLKRRQERLLLAVLLLAPGKVVPTDRLIGLLWPEEQPGSPKRALQVYVSRLRAALTAADPAAQLVAERQGYALHGAAGRTDLERFNELVGRARALQELEQRRELLVEALDLWRGPALADVASEDVRRRLCGGLDESRWAAHELRLRTDLALGRHQELLPELAQLTGVEPTREGLAATRMIALYRSGRQAEALAVYTELVRHLDDELGVEPGEEVRDLQVAMLRQDESLSLPAAPTGPRELPADVGLLVGRDELLDELSDVLLSAKRRNGVPAVVSLYGGAGTGKSAAAVRLGRRLADEYGDGQVFVRLQDVQGDAVPARVVLARLLRSLGVESQLIPDSLEERSSLLRSTLAGRAVLLVFDDVLDAGQLRPLLPADGRCAVVATSRQPLLGLEDAVHREVLPLGDERSGELLRSLTGLPQAELAEIIQYCAGLPLALRIVGARLGIAKEKTADVLKALADDASRLDYLVAGDRAVRASLEVTLRSADPAAQRLFALLHLVDADEFSSWVAAPLLGLSEPRADAVFDGLVALGLLQQRRTEPPTYGMHGLVRSYSAELLQQISPEVRTGIEERYLGTVLRLLTIADEQVEHGIEVLIQMDSGSDRSLPGVEAAAAQGANWLDVQLPVMTAAIQLAVRSQPRLAGMLALRLHGYLAVRDHREARDGILREVRDEVAAAGHVGLEAELDQAVFSASAQWSAPIAELTTLAERCLDSAERAGGMEALVRALSQVAWTAEASADAGRHLELALQMLALAEENPAAESLMMRALDHLGGAVHQLGRIDEAQHAYRRSVELTPGGTRLNAIRSVNLAESLLSGPDQGTDHVSEVTELLSRTRETVQQLGDELGGAYVSATQARLLVVVGDLNGADEHLEQAASVFRRRPDPIGELAVTMGRTCLQFALGLPAAARKMLGAQLQEYVDSDFHYGRARLLQHWALIDPEGCPDIGSDDVL
ncbi:AfsR/SARP family transcriptional regulator [Kribbella sp. CA-293567]|uniref:AfsR/SARP family transcriptional regulator n=1 Tax=Kribbella sp. CA-293567 TaxID=3002436 RepID=UPI0022DD45C0|nr:AfsR/SARP family transcriptional regulator [Kribbella sp. CA-293567]WBQ02753.1 BTAD domain-containing putative transcriptional regulator [Kribbella sp. CA-293567]